MRIDDTKKLPPLWLSAMPLITLVALIIIVLIYKKEYPTLVEDILSLSDCNGGDGDRHKNNKHYLFNN
jgi:hypothetical protein